MKFNLVIALVLLTPPFLPVLNAQDHYFATDYPKMQRFHADFMLEGDNEPQEHDEESLEVAAPIRPPIGSESLNKDFFQSRRSVDGDVGLDPPGAAQDGVSAGEGAPGTAQDENVDSGCVDDDLEPSQIEKSVSPSKKVRCLNKIMDMLREIKRELIKELKGKRRNACIHKNASSLNCLCGFFSATDDPPEVPLTYRNMSGESKGNHSDAACVESCISFTLKQHTLVYDLICYDTNHLNQTTVHLYTSPDQELEELEWKYSGYEMQTPVCCHQGRKVECSTLEEEEDKIEF